MKKATPSRRSELYEEGIDLLLRKWNNRHSIEREQVYKLLSPKRKEDLLSQISWIAFDRGKYFLPQEELEWYITDCIRKFPEAQTDP